MFQFISQNIFIVFFLNIHVLVLLARGCLDALRKESVVLSVIAWLCKVDLLLKVFFNVGKGGHVA